MAQSVSHSHLGRSALLSTACLVHGKRLYGASAACSPRARVSRRAVQPSNIPDVAFRYGVQIGQAFGLDFGIGFIRDICFVSFAIV